DLSSVWCTWRHALFSAAEFDSGSALHTDRRGRIAVALHPDHLLSFALVGRAGCSLRSKTAPDYWSANSGPGLFAFSPANNWRQLLDKFLPTDCPFRIRYCL